jgi:phenylacetate-CoA ligase
MPFVRYRTGDMGMWAYPPRYHGEVRFVMQRIEGRCQEFVVCADHRLVSITTLGSAHFHELSQVDRIQFEQHTPGRVTLKVISSNDLHADDRARIGTAVREKTQGGCEVEVERVAHIERTARGKHRMLIQHLDLSTYLGAAHAGEPERELNAEARP